MERKYRHIIDRKFAALFILAVVLGFSLIKNFHVHNSDCVHVHTEEVSFIPYVEDCAICSYWLSSYESNKVEVFWLVSLVTAFILIPAVRKAEAEVQHRRPLRAPPVF